MKDNMGAVILNPRTLSLPVYHGDAGYPQFNTRLAKYRFGLQYLTFRDGTAGYDWTIGPIVNLYSIQPSCSFLKK